MRVILSLLTLITIYCETLSQCLHTKIETIFDYECTSGNFNGGRIGIDSIVHIATAYVAVDLQNNTFILYKNGVAQSGLNIEYDAGDIIKIKPQNTGVSNIIILSDESGCPTSYSTNPDKEGCFQTSLPVTWLSFPTANIKNKQSHILWSVASQVNNSHFIIEHSTDGRSYAEIDKVQGHGNTSETKQYTYIHEAPSIGANYYRIKQVDYDGQSSYSDVMSVMYESDGGDVRIYPNPVSYEVTLSISEPMEVEVTDILGKVLHKQTVNRENNVLDVSGMPSGLLIFSLQNGQRVKVIKD